MSYGKIKTDMVCLEGFFTWEIDNFDRMFDMTAVPETHGSQIETSYTGPEIVAKNPHDGKEYKNKFMLKFLRRRNRRGWNSTNFLIFDLENEDDFHSVEYYYCVRDDNVWKSGYHIQNCDYEFVKIRADVTFPITQTKMSFESSDKRSLTECVVSFWKTEPADKFTIKCDDAAIDVSKRVLAVRSPVFKAMIDSSMKEGAESTVEIVEFPLEVVKKMVEFCETDKVENLDGCESELYRIAHKYQMRDLVLYAMEKMSDGLNFDNFTEYLTMADLYDLKDFKRWIMSRAGSLSDNKVENKTGDHW